MAFSKGNGECLPGLSQLFICRPVYISCTAKRQKTAWRGSGLSGCVHPLIDLAAEPLRGQKRTAADISDGRNPVTRRIPIFFIVYFAQLLLFIYVAVPNSCN